ncbi:MAG: mRNA surveillance protein Pelota [Desulfurococcaceae archaeon]
MRIVEKKLDKGYVVLQLETPDDLWILYTVIESGDVVASKTTREVKFEGSGESRRIPMNIALRVEEVEYQQFSDKLRVRGVVVEGPDEHGVIGKHHALSIGIGSIVVLYKEKWPKVLLDRLEKASNSRENVLLVAIDYEEIGVALLTSQGLQKLIELYSHLPGKDSPGFEEELENYLNRAADSIAELINRHEVNVVIIGGPGQLKHRVGNKILEKICRKILLYYDSTSMGGYAGLLELSKRDVVTTALKDVELIKAEKAFNEFTKLLQVSESMVAYGLMEVEEAAISNAIKTLLVSESSLKASNDEERRMLLKLIEEAYAKGSEVIVVPRGSDVEAQVKSFGGVIAILRYSLMHRETRS